MSFSINEPCQVMWGLNSHQNNFNPSPHKDAFEKTVAKGGIAHYLPQYFQLCSINILSFTETFHISGYTCVFSKLSAADML